MRFLVITHVRHKRSGGAIYAYGPYVREMNLWFGHVGEVEVVAPLREVSPDPIDLPYRHDHLTFTEVPAFNLTTAGEALKTLFKLPLLFYRIFRAMARADHIHLRCPGNMGLLGAMAQLFFPHKSKTAKYAGNWDPQSAQPWSYRLQKRILSNPLLTKNMRVLVYGEWPGQSRNVLPFFTATYHEREKEAVRKTPLPSGAADPGTVRLLFVGALSPNKRPLLSVQAAQRLRTEGYDVRLDLFGEGPERGVLERYIAQNGLEGSVTLHGNRNAEEVKARYKQSHFLVFVSRSEGWPKVVAEAMFWGCLPVTTDVSCVRYMIGEGSRGSIAEPNADDIVKRVKYYLMTAGAFEQASGAAMEWSRRFTLERFEEEIGKLLDEA